MAPDAAVRPTIRCHGCGYETTGDGEWGEVDHPPLGTLTQCPKCGSTDVGHLVSNRQ